MAKRGLMYYLTLNVGVTMVAYIIYYTYKSTKHLKEYKNAEEMYLKAEDKPKLITQNELRLMGERNKSDKVPLSDNNDKGGYM